MIKESGFGSVPLTNGSGFGSGRPKCGSGGSGFESGFGSGSETLVFAYFVFLAIGSSYSCYTRCEASILSILRDYKWAGSL